MIAIIECPSGDLNTQFCIERKTIEPLLTLFLSAMRFFLDLTLHHKYILFISSSCHRSDQKSPQSRLINMCDTQWHTHSEECERWRAQSLQKLKQHANYSENFQWELKARGLRVRRWSQSPVWGFRTEHGLDTEYTLTSIVGSNGDISIVNK
jgi:hypothetical protein